MKLIDKSSEARASEIEAPKFLPTPFFFSSFLPRQREDENGMTGVKESSSGPARANGAHLTSRDSRARASLISAPGLIIGRYLLRD